MAVDTATDPKLNATSRSVSETIRELREDLDNLENDSPDTDRLRDVIGPLKGRIEEGHATHESVRTFVEAVLEDLGTRARNEHWRAPLAKAGALEFALAVLKRHGLQDDLKANLHPRKLSYRLIANVCADEDEGREVLLREWADFVGCFKSDVLKADRMGGWSSIAGAACAALLNYLMEFEAATKQLLEARLDKVFLEVLQLFHRAYWNESSGASLPDSFWDVMLEWFERWRPEEADVELGEFTCTLLDSFDDVAGFPDDDAETWIPVISKLFNEEPVRVAFARSEKRFTQLLRVFYNIQERYESSTNEELTKGWAVPTTPLADFAPLDGPHLKDREVTDLWTTISMVIGQEEFPETYSSLDGPIPRQMIKWIGWPESGHEGVNEHFIQLATLAIGNLSRLERYPQFLEDVNMADRLCGVINHASEDQTRFLALDLLKHCFLKSSTATKDSSMSKVTPGLILALNAVAGMNWMAAHASLSTARVMVTPANLSQLLETLDVENTISENADRNSSYWTRALQISKATTIHDLKLAVGRLIAAVLRCTHSAGQTDGQPIPNGDHSPRLFSPGLDVSEPLGAMVTSGIDEGPRKMVHSEGWFAMALLAKSKEGAGMIVGRLRQEDVNSALLRVLDAGQDSDSASPQKVHQRQNVIVMLKSIQKHGLEVQREGLGQSIEELMATLTTEDVVLQQP